MKHINLSGQQFGRLTVIKRAENNKFGKATWLCRCQCGNEKAVIGSKLTTGETKSCGCWRAEAVREARKTHGASYDPLYNRYKSMLNRCLNPNNNSYARYGAKGVTVCDRWRNSYADFLADMGEPPTGFTLDRIDSSKGYEPGNCRWASPKQQAENSSKPRVIEFDGKSMNLTEWSNHLGIATATLIERLQKWPLEKALGTPKKTWWIRRTTQPRTA